MSSATMVTLPLPVLDEVGIRQTAEWRVAAELSDVTTVEGGLTILSEIIDDHLRPIQQLRSELYAAALSIREHGPAPGSRSIRRKRDVGLAEASGLNRSRLKALRDAIPEGEEIPIVPEAAEKLPRLARRYEACRSRVAVAIEARDAAVYVLLERGMPSVEIARLIGRDQSRVAHLKRRWRMNLDYEGSGPHLRWTNSLGMRAGKADSKNSERPTARTVALVSFAPDAIPRPPADSAAPFLVDPAERDHATRLHHAAARYLAEAALAGGYSVTAPNHNQDCAFVDRDILVNIEVKTASTWLGAGVKQLRLGLGQLLEQRRLHLDDRDAGHWEDLSLGDVVSVLAVDAPPGFFENLEWRRWSRTCAEVGVVLSSVQDLAQNVRTGCIPRVTSLDSAADVSR